MASITINPIADISYISEQDIYGSENQKILFEISQGYREIIKTVLEGSDYPKYDFNEENYDYSKEQSIFGVVAKGIYEYSEGLSSAKGHDDFIRHDAISIWLDIFGAGSSEISKNQDEIGKRLLFYIRKKINENLDHKRRWYPAITKLLLSLHGIYETGDGDD